MNTDIFDKIIKGCVYALLVLIPLWFLPFTTNVLDFNKQFLLIFLTMIALIAWLGKVLALGKIRWRNDKLTLALLAFVVIYCLATIFSLRPYSSFFGFSTHLSGGLVNVLSFVILFLLIVNNVRKEKDIFRFVFVFLASTALVSIIGILQVWGGFIFPWNFAKTNSFNTVGSVSSLGIFLAAVLPLIIGLVFAIRSAAREMKIFLGGLGALIFLLILSLNLRVVWITLAAGMVVLLAFGMTRRKKKILGALGTTTGVGWLVWPMGILAISLLFLLFRIFLPLGLDLPAEVGLSYQGGWNVLSEVLKNRPVLGTGPETFVFNYAQYRPETINQTAFWNIRFTNPPAEIFSVVSDTGILGILAILGVIVFFVMTIGKSLIQRETDFGWFLKLGLFSGWIGLLVSWFFYPQNLTLMFLFWIFLALAVVKTAKREEIKKLVLESASKKALAISFAFIILIMFAVGLLYFEGARLVAEAKYRSGLDLVQVEGELDEGIDKVIRATIINPREDRFFRNLAQLFLLKANQEVIRTDISQEERAAKVQVAVSNAINSATSATNLSPKDVSNWIVRGNIYRNVMPLIGGADEWAIKSYEEALKIEPLNPLVYTELGRVYITRADTLLQAARSNQEARKQRNEALEKALEMFNKAIEIKGDYSPAHFQMALAFDRQGRLKEAIAKMEGNKRFTPFDIGVAFQLGVLYYKDSQFNKAKAEFSRVIALNDDFSNAHYFLGLLYDREGEKAKAILEFEKIAELNPGNENVEAILANLKAGRPALGSPELGPPKQPEEIPIEKELEEE